MIWDLFFKDIINLPNSGMDSEIFFFYSAEISKNLSLLSENLRGGLYSKFIGLIFYFIGIHRSIGQYINVLFGLSTLFFIFFSLKALKIKQDTTQMILLIAAIFPNSLVMSSIFLREIIPTFFVSLSLYCFILWYKKAKLSNFILSMIFLIIASLFHSGLIGIFIGYFFGVIFYNPKKYRFKLTMYSISIFSIALIGLFYFYTRVGYSYIGKITEIESYNELLLVTNSRLGGSAYLKNIKINSLSDFILFSPAKMFFFLSSPLPMNWRNIIDIFSFLFDSMFFLIVIFYLFINRKLIKNNKLILLLIIAIVSVTFIFGHGVSNAGTAIRHRQKLTPLFFVIISLLMNEKTNVYKKKFIINQPNSFI